MFIYKPKIYEQKYISVLKLFMIKGLYAEVDLKKKMLKLDFKPSPIIKPTSDVLKCSVEIL